MKYAKLDNNINLTLNTKHSLRANKMMAKEWKNNNSNNKNNQRS